MFPTYVFVSNAENLGYETANPNVFGFTDDSITFFGVDPVQQQIGNIFVALENYGLVVDPSLSYLNLSDQPAVILLSALDTDGSLTSNSDERVASQKATKTYVDTAITNSKIPASVVVILFVV